MAGGLARYVLKPVPLTVLDALSVVNAPAAGVVAPTVPLSAPANDVLAVMVVPVMAAAAVPPMAGGLARYVLNPVPLTVLDALRVVNAPAAGVVAPTVPLSAPAKDVLAVMVVPVMAAIAIRLLLGLAASAPEIGLSRFDRHGEGGFLGDVGGVGHGGLVWVKTPLSPFQAHFQAS
jgi:hypothetical protein